MSNLLSEMINCIEASNDDEVIPCDNINTPILKMVIDYCKYYTENPPSILPLDYDNATSLNDISSWDYNFLQTEDKTMLFDLVNAAHFLDIKSLEQVTCKMIANEIKGKTTEQIRQMFKIENDFTPAEEEELKRNTEWVKEKPFTCPDHPI
nr:uncharacterized protein LOC128703350 [Cherax quadricarinatus]